jgi:membrane dipeptidase
MTLVPPTRHMLIWDNVVPLVPEVGNDFAMLARYRAAGHTMVSLTIAGDDCGLAEAMHRLARARALIAAHGPDYVLATSAADIRRAYADGRMAIGLHLEGTECLERDVDMIDLAYDLGIRHAILAFNQNNSASGGCMDLEDVGLSRLGRRYLERMRDVGMLLDASHMSRRATLEAMDAMGVPVVFTHSNADALFPHYRNVTDEQARACAATGGLIGISGSTMYLGFEDSLPRLAFRHIDHFVQLIGPDHVGLGTDYIVDAKATARILASRPDEWPHDDLSAPLYYMPPEDLGELIGEMGRAGYDDDSIAGILGGNYLRIADSVWK